MRSVNSSHISSSSSTTYNRVIGRIDAAGNINTATAADAYNAAAVRGAATTDGTMMWISSEIGIGYTTLNSTAVPVALSIVNTRALGIFGSGNTTQLFGSSSATTYLGVNTIGTGTPNTAGVTVTRLSGFTDASGDPAKNEELAKQRAFAVRDALKAAGVAEDKIELKKPEQLTGSGDAAQARRVEVALQ